MDRHLPMATEAWAEPAVPRLSAPDARSGRAEPGGGIINSETMIRRLACPAEESLLT